MFKLLSRKKLEKRYRTIIYRSLEMHANSERIQYTGTEGVKTKRNKKLYITINTHEFLLIISFTTVMNLLTMGCSLSRPNCLR